MFFSIYFCTIFENSFLSGRSRDHLTVPFKGILIYMLEVQVNGYSKSALYSPDFPLSFGERRYMFSDIHKSSPQVNV